MAARGWRRGCASGLHLHDRDEGHPERRDLVLRRGRAVDPQHIVGLEPVDDVAGGTQASSTDVVEDREPECFDFGRG